MTIANEVTTLVNRSRELIPGGIHQHDGERRGHVEFTDYKW